MLLKVVLLFVAGVVAFTILDGQPNGIYEVSYDASGVETHTLIFHNVTSRGLVNIVKFPKRSFSSGTATCAGEPLLNAGDTDAANSLLDGYCGEGRTITPYYDAYALYDCTVSYFCNFYNGPAYCSASQRQEATANVAQVCGSYVPGWWTFVDVDVDASYGSEYYCTLPGQDFCGHSH